MIIRWNGHSCFTVETAQGTVVLDPYAPDSVPGLPALDLKGDAVLCSHGHADHSAADQVTLSGGTCAVAVEEIPGNYYIARNLSFAFRAVVYSNKNLRDTLYEYNIEINKELARKQEEFSY